MQYAVVANADIFDETEFKKRYYIRLMSPRMTVPCHMAICVPMKTSPMTVALGARKIAFSLTA